MRDFIAIPAMDKESVDRLKEKTARISVISNTGLVLMKFVVGFAIGSVSIISETIHSSMDLLAAVIVFVSVKKIRRAARHCTFLRAWQI
jgi:divalent metal cation (Fe/Co/Zn/Cd) transporter